MTFQLNNDVASVYSGLDWWAFGEAIRKKGWSCTVTSMPANFTVSMEATCPHGWSYCQLIYKELLLKDDTCNQVMEDAFLFIEEQCKDNHADLPTVSQQASAPVPSGSQSVSEELAEVFSNVREYVQVPCSCTRYEDTGLKVHVLVVHLNDFHNWTRERIADWLDTLDLDLTLKPTGSGD